VLAFIDMPVIIGLLVTVAVFALIAVAITFWVVRSAKRPMLTPRAFGVIAAKRGLDVRVDGLSAVQVESRQAAALVDLAEELGIFVLGIEGFTRLEGGGFSPNLAWIFDASPQYTRGTPEAAVALARRFLEIIPKSNEVFLEFVLVTEGWKR